MKGEGEHLVVLRPGQQGQLSHWLMMTFGVVLPVATVLFEVITRMCAEVLFDPIPTVWHTLVVLMVPAVNLLLLGSRPTPPEHLKWLALAAGAALAVSGFYALLFLPLTPFAIIAIVYLGLGLLALAPLTSFVTAIALSRRLTTRSDGIRLGRRLAAGIALGVSALIVLDIPPAATRLGLQLASSEDAGQRGRGLWLLRRVGDRTLHLRLCYDSLGQPAGLLSAIVAYGGGRLVTPRESALAVTTEQAREVWYRAHGEPFNLQPAPIQSGRWSRFGDFDFDSDLGGTVVGGRVKGLALTSSRLDGSIAGDDAVAYLEWTFEVQNAAAVEREARLQIALPPGGVVSRATLWINGEEREAAYGGRAEVRAAYQKVAVRQRRDPLLVTTKGADRVLLQAFPVPRNGGTMRFKVGITAPLQLDELSRGRLTLPAIVDRNLSFAKGSEHAVWIESRQPLAATAAGLEARRISDGLHRLSGAVGDPSLARDRPSIAVERDPGVARRLARLGDGPLVRQEISAHAGPPVRAVMLLVDGSKHMRPALPGLLAALDRIPDGVKVGIVVAGEPIRSVPVAPWSAARKGTVAALLRSIEFEGGQDNSIALAESLAALEGEPDALLLWVHGPQPIQFRQGAARLEQAGARLSRLPRVVLYQAVPGPNELLPDAAWAWSAEAASGTGRVDVDLGRIFTRMLAAGALEPRRSLVTASADEPVQGSQHIARLWARDRILELMRANATANRKQAVDLAVEHRIVTPVSGAVVLETQQQYEENRLTPAAQASVPTVPEPHEWALLALAAALLIWVALARGSRVKVA